MCRHPYFTYGVVTILQWKKGLTTGLLSFLLTVILSLILLWKDQINTIYIGLIMFFVIMAGIFFDIIGTAATAATEKELHAMAADKVSGATEAIFLVRRADRVANFCNDMIGDICGTVSGAMASALSIRFFSLLSAEFELLVIALAAALTIGGKAIGKQYAIAEANQIIFFVGRCIYFIRRRKKEPNKKNRNLKKKRS